MTEIQLANTVARLRKLYDKAFCAETSYSGTLNKECPAQGHCALVALDIFMCLGGQLISCKVGEISHWYNKLQLFNTDGSSFSVYLDVTGDQFGKYIIQFGRVPLYGGEHKVRDAKEISEETWNRYKKFVSRMA